MKTIRLFPPLFVVVLLLLAACSHQPGRQQITFKGGVRAGERFEHQFGERFLFVLEPSEFGWLVAVYERGRPEDLTRLTPPFHFVPNPTEIDGWHFRNEDNTGSNDGSVNAPQREREFIFSPEVGRSIAGPAAHAQPTSEEVERVRSFGWGVLYIDQLKLSPPERGHRATILEMRFHGTISWSHRVQSGTQLPTLLQSQNMRYNSHEHTRADREGSGEPAGDASA